MKATTRTKKTVTRSSRSKKTAPKKEPSALSYRTLDQMIIALNQLKTQYPHFGTRPLILIDKTDISHRSLAMPQSAVFGFTDAHPFKAFPAGCPAIVVEQVLP